MTKPKRVALYLRVSDDESTIENQRLKLEQVAARHGWEIVATYQDEAISGAKGRDKRPGYNDLMKGVARREFDLVAAWAVDRLGRSLHELLNFMMELHGKNIDMYLHEQAIDTSTVFGRAMFQIAGVFAELERGMTIERVHAGLDRARKQGKRLGRPPVMTPKLEQQARKRLAAGTGILKVAKELGVGTGTIQKIANDMKAEKAA